MKAGLWMAAKLPCFLPPVTCLRRRYTERKGVFRSSVDFLCNQHRDRIGVARDGCPLQQGLQGMARFFSSPEISTESAPFGHGVACIDASHRRKLTRCWGIHPKHGAPKARCGERHRGRFCEECAGLPRQHVQSVGTTRVRTKTEEAPIANTAPFQSAAGTLQRMQKPRRPACSDGGTAAPPGRWHGRSVWCDGSVHAPSKTRRLVLPVRSTVLLRLLPCIVQACAEATVTGPPVACARR